MFPTPGSRRFYACGARGVIAPKVTLLSRATTVSEPYNSFFTANWDWVLADDVGAFSLSAPSMIVTPLGYSRVRIAADSLSSSPVGANTNGWAQLFINGSGHIGSVYKNGDFIGVRLITDWIDTVPGDQFSIQFQHQAGVGNFLWGQSINGNAMFGAEWAKK